MNFKFVMTPYGVVFFNLAVPHEEVYVTDAGFRIKPSAWGISYRKKSGHAYTQIGFAHDASCSEASRGVVYRDWGVRHSRCPKPAFVHMYPTGGMLFFFPFSSTADCGIRMKSPLHEPASGSIEGFLSVLAPHG